MSDAAVGAYDSETGVARCSGRDEAIDPDSPPRGRGVLVGSTTRALSRAAKNSASRLREMSFVSLMSNDPSTMGLQSGIR